MKVLTSKIVNGKKMFLIEDNNPQGKVFAQDGKPIKKENISNYNPYYVDIKGLNASESTKTNLTPATKITPQEIKKIKESPTKVGNIKIKEAQEKAQRLKEAEEAYKKRKAGAPITPELLAQETQAIGDKISLQNIPGVGQYIPDMLDVTGGIGSMASSLGRMPLNIKQRNYGQAALSVAIPLGVGALAGIGTQNTNQFVNNLVNPLAGTGDLINNLGNKYLPNAHKLNPFAFKPNSEMMYRGIGKEGMEDALESGVFRAKQNVAPIMDETGRFDMSKQFQGTYYSPKFNTADQYGAGYIAEVPKDVTNFRLRYKGKGNKTWSQIADENIPISKGKILEKNWLKGYKEVPKNLQEDIVDLYRIQEKGAKTFTQLAAEGKIPKAFNNEKTITKKAEEEKYFGQWFTKDKADLDWYARDREFTNPEIINLKVPKSKLSQYQNYDKSLSKAPEREFVIPHAEQKLYNDFKSEIDWSKWNKEIPENKALMQEYNAIEQQAKANGTWMKNPDGSKFQGTPEQFVQQNSENFKKAFPEYHGEILNHNTNAELNTIDESFFNKGAGDTGYYGKGTYAHPKKEYTKMYGKNNYELYLNSKNKGFLDKSNIDDAEYFKRSDNEILQHHLPEYENKLMNYKLDPSRYYDNAKENWLNKLNEQVKAGKISRDKLDEFTSLHNPKNGEVVIPFNNRVKSAVGNNGMFDMTNPNIYKTLVGGLATGTLGKNAMKKKEFGGKILDTKIENGKKYFLINE